jgi:hypothetical protein
VTRDHDTGGTAENYREVFSLLRRQAATFSAIAVNPRTNAATNAGEHSPQASTALGHGPHGIHCAAVDESEIAEICRNVDLTHARQQAVDHRAVATFLLDSP